ncbi:DinB family protein [Pedobacter miscanthi]|uniref:DinB superfamily protein n=1 Tax=Pedobacter miscanthi TaxID=2259170 RepID=A0A366KUR2_9SPHI|nr:DUF1572 family protein [Pedobacter miscanthi]RBQ05366.1 DinB superfamily protein [Pedobacter miscanthi]
MLTETLKKLFNRDLTRLKAEIEAYRNEANLWRIDQAITNPAGNLCLHLIGNLNTYIGATLGGTGYIRNRELEFSLKDIPKQQLINMIEETAKAIDETLEHLTNEQIDGEYPLLVFEEKTTTGFFLVHLATHLTYHLGQINYHRRLLDCE